MNIKEYYQVIINNLRDLTYQSEYYSPNASSGRPYFAQKLTNLRLALKGLDLITFIQPQIERLKKTELFSTDADTYFFSTQDDSTISAIVQEIRTGIEYVMGYVQLNEKQLMADCISIKLPEVHGFDDLSRVSNDLKKAIELPVSDQNAGGIVQILSAEKGSIWLTVSLGASSAFQLVAAICWAAAVMRRKRGEMVLFENHARSLNLPNVSFEALLDAQDRALQTTLSNEADAIISKHFDIIDDNEAVSRMKLAINTISDLIDKGARILPSSANEDLQKMFPDYNQLSIVESNIKQLQN